MEQIIAHIIAVIVVFSGIIACLWCAIIQSQLNNLITTIKKACEIAKKEQEEKETEENKKDE